LFNLGIEPILGAPFGPPGASVGFLFILFPFCLDRWYLTRL
jgi:hypothetical protein